MSEASQSQQWDYPEQDPDYKGNALDEILKQGPVEDRHCTDVIWCLLYVINWAMLVGISIYAFTNGTPSQVFAPFNSYNYQCGVSNTLQSCPYAFIDFNMDTVYCVSSCPSSNMSTVTCCNCTLTPQYYESDNFKSVCQPRDQTDQEMQQYNSMMEASGIENAITEVDRVWPVTLGVCFISFFLSIIVVLLIKLYASWVIWIVYSVFVLLLVALGNVCYFYALDVHFGRNWLLGVAYTSWVFAVLALLMLICLCNKIRLAIAVMKAAADFTEDVKAAPLVPFVMFAITICFFVFWVFSSSYLLACGNAIQNGGSPFPGLDLSESIKWMLAGNFFGFYWNVNFAMCYVQFVIGSACSMWYFHDLGQDLHNAIGKSVYRGIIYHSGSIALGSFILTLIKMIQFIFSCIYRCLKNAVLNNREAEGCLKCCCECCSCCIKYFESYVRFLDCNAFVMMGINGKSFCPAAHDAFYLIHRSSNVVSVTDGVGEVFTTISNLFIAVAATLCGFLMVTNIQEYTSISPILPSIFFAVISLVVASFFMNVYGVAVDTILLCYLADVELFKSEGGPKCPPKQLTDFLKAYYMT